MMDGEMWKRRDPVGRGVLLVPWSIFGGVLERYMCGVFKRVGLVHRERGRCGMGWDGMGY